MQRNARAASVGSAPFLKFSRLYQACLFQRFKGTVSCDRFKRSRAESHCDMAIELWDPDAFHFQIRQEKTGSVGGYMAPDSTLFLGHTAPMNDMALRGLCSSDFAFS